MISSEIEVAIIGGSGFYELLDDASHVNVDTPFGSPSGQLTVGSIAGRGVVFLPRHGPGHHIPPHRIPYRANLWSLAHLGVTRVLSPCAVGSLRPDIHPGQFVLCDQFIDRTWGRADTFYDGPDVYHASLADPYCPELRSAVHDALSGMAVGVHRTGTMVVVQGPRFASKAESAWYRNQGWDVVNMTQYPEVALARELGLCYSSLALVTDYDTGVDGVDTIAAVSMETVFAVLQDMVATVRSCINDAVKLIPTERSCSCRAGAGPAVPSSTIRPEADDD